MPATEQTWRDSKLLHMVFGLCALAMLGTTIWMLAADHRREWKDYQRNFQHVEEWTAAARINQEQSQTFDEKTAELKKQLEAARQVVPEQSEIDKFEVEVASNASERKLPEPNFDGLRNTYAALAAAKPEERPALNDKLAAQLAEFTKRAKFHEEQLASDKKFKAADLEVARSEYDLGVGNELPKSTLAEYQKKVNEHLDEVAAANDAAQNATEHRKALEKVVADMTAEQERIRKELVDHETALAQLTKTKDERENSFMKELTQLPILDAFGKPIKIDQVWLPKLTINYNFGAVGDIARFDRCVTCHQAIAESAPGSATEPRYEAEKRLTVSLETPAEKPAALAELPEEADARALKFAEILEATYGLRFSDHRFMNVEEPIVEVVRRETPGAKARLEMGDVVELVDGAQMLTRHHIYAALLESVSWGKPLKLTVRRGLPHPYASHPRLDLFTGSLSPHKKDDVGCTICHDGQGSATAFKWASHSPNDPFEAIKWKREHGWFDNHHWIYPMTPNRFTESLCLKCHHDVTELEPSERFPDPPALKLVEGFQLVKEFGCFGCHEVSGFDGPNKRVGPDLRTEPPYSAAALALLAGGGLSDQQQAWAKELSAQPGNDATRRQLGQSLDAQDKEGKLPGKDPIVTRKLLKLLDELETPGKLRRVGPSLRHVASKNDFNFLYSWIRKPSDFRPSTKMPQFFGLESHLDGKGLGEAKKFEPIEIRTAVEYLLTKSQPFEYARPDGKASEASAERGKTLFEVRGCLACHKHSDFPAGTMTQGPDLSRIGAKLGGEDQAKGKPWLYTWLLNPNNYHARTFMPNVFLTPITDADGKVTDPAADITEYLMGSTQDWKPTDIPGKDLTDDEKKALRELALEHLKTVFARRQAEQYLEKGIPEDRRSELKGDEVELVGEPSIEKEMQFVGRRTITKYGCSGCHDIPGFEDAKPIGTGLADWGRKDPAKLAFEQIVEYMKHAHGKPGSFEPHTSGNVTDKEIEEADEGQYGHTHFNFEDFDPDTGYFMEKLFTHQRQGFIWQKLREPRSYDYKKTQNKGYNERLRMPQFTALTDAQREAIITFVLGLVAEPPPPQYVFKPTPRRDAIVQGLQVIDKFNCTGCHAFSMDKWELTYAPDDFPEAPPVADFDFLNPHFTPTQKEASLKTDDAGMRKATIVGMPGVGEDGQPARVDDGGAPLEADDKETPGFYSFLPFDNTLINGEARPAGYKFLVPEQAITKRYPPLGGFLARLAFPAVLAAEKQVNPNVVAEEVWGWVPPPLVGEGKKVQSAWLYDFLLDPHLIRPSVVLRMPKFNMSPEESRKLVNYFAAVDGADYPYNFDPRTRDSHLAAAMADHPKRFDDALNIVIDNSYCVKCHLLGDFEPKGSDRAKAPQLDRVFRRLRPDWTHDWVANPKRILPFTSMPVNIPYDKGVSQQLFKGTPAQQLDGVVDLLMNFDRFTEGRVKIAPLIKPAAPETPAAAAENTPPAQSGGPAQ